jgi:hypothetical protein
MASTEPLDIFQNVRALKDRISQTWHGGKFQRWEVDYNVMAWPLSNRAPGDSAVWDYYLIQVEGSTGFLTGDSSWSLAAHAVGAYPIPVSDTVNPNATTLAGMEVLDYGGVELVDTSPAGSIGQTSYTTGISTTIGGSVGMMGEMPTASVSASVTTSHSETRSVSDLTITNRSRLDGSPPLDASWRFEVTPGTPMATGECPIVVEFLYRVPHGRPTFAFSLGWSAFLTGGDLNELTELPEVSNWGVAGAVGVMPGFSNPLDVFLRDKAVIKSFRTITLTAPPAPPAA